MYHRRKLLLAILEAFGGELRSVDCHKLVFLYCQRTNQNHYDFFPYKYGACSFTLHQDKLRLTDLGHLEPGDSFRLKTNSQFTSQLDMFSQNELNMLVNEVGPLRGNELLRKVYLEYPYYATRSSVAANILTPSEYKPILAYHSSATEARLFTIGYEGLTIDYYLNSLISNGISALVDVRKNPISRKYGFSKQQLKKYIENIGLLYLHFPELGVPSATRQNLDSEQAYSKLLKQYTESILPNQTEAINKLRDVIYEKDRVALTCFEASHHCCHRSKITEHFSNDRTFEVPIQHL